MDESEILKFEQAIRPLKLSEAIRIGAKLRPQCQGYLFRDGASCALGAAYEGMGGKPVEGESGTPAYDNIYNTLYRQFGTTLCAVIHDKNDDGATRESIADWLESEGY